MDQVTLSVLQQIQNETQLIHQSPAIKSLPLHHQPDFSPQSRQSLTLIQHMRLMAREGHENCMWRE